MLNLPASGIRCAEGRQLEMRRGLLLTAVAALVAFATCSPALAQETTQETPGEKGYCAEPAPTTYQYECDEPQPLGCAPQQQYDDETDGCTADPYQYACTTSTSCNADSEAQNSIADGGIQSLPPASVQNVVVSAAKSVFDDAAEASRALDTAEPVDPANNVAIAAESEQGEEPPTSLSGVSEEAVGDIAPPPATAPLPAPPPETATAPAKATEVTESVEVVTDQKRELEKVDSDPAASHENEPVDRFVVPLFALGGSTLLIAGGLLVRKLVG